MDDRVSAQAQDHRLVIRVQGRLGLNLHHEFRQAFRPYLEAMDSCEVDLSDCTGIDSSGMALLLILREQSGLNPAQLSITHCPEDVVRVLGYANFNKLFTIN